MLKKVFIKPLDDEKQSDVYWLAHECLRSAGVEVPVFGALFLDTLAKVEVLDDDPSQ